MYDVLFRQDRTDWPVVRRMRDQPFPRYHLDNQKECEEFADALKSLLECVPLTIDVLALLTRWRWFGEWSLGCVGVLGDWIVETVDALWSAGETVLTVEALTRHALQPDQRARLEMEARTGEYRVARAKAQSELELQQFLGASVLDGKPIPANPASLVTPAGGQERKGGRIERAAQRDPVGDQIPIRSSLLVMSKNLTISYCTFYRPFHYQNSAYGIKRFTPEITAFFA